MKPPSDLKERIIREAKSSRLGFILAGVTTPYPPPHLSSFENWIHEGRHASMDYLASDRSRARRADLHLILPECKSILMVALPYANPKTASVKENVNGMEGQIAAYTWGDDYHLVITERLQALVAFIEEQVGHPILKSLVHRYRPDSRKRSGTTRRLGMDWQEHLPRLIHVMVPIFSSPKFCSALNLNPIRHFKPINAELARAASKPVRQNVFSLIEPLMRGVVFPI